MVFNIKMKGLSDRPYFFLTNSKYKEYLDDN